MPGSGSKKHRDKKKKKKGSSRSASPASIVSLRSWSGTGREMKGRSLCIVCRENQ